AGCNRARLAEHAVALEPEFGEVGGRRISEYRTQNQLRGNDIPDSQEKQGRDRHPCSDIPPMVAGQGRDFPLGGSPPKCSRPRPRRQPTGQAQPQGEKYQGSWRHYTRTAYSKSAAVRLGRLRTASFAAESRSGDDTIRPIRASGPSSPHMLAHWSRY